jgi:hypothetical protein
MMSHLLMCHDKEGDMAMMNDLERVPCVMPDESVSRASALRDFGTSGLRDFGPSVFGTFIFRTSGLRDFRCFGSSGLRGLRLFSF